MKTANNALQRRRAQRGLTLIELMISMTIGLIVVGALSYVYVGSRGTYRVNEGLARVQETGRFMLDYLGQDLRMTNFAGCRSRSLTTDPGEGGVRFTNITANPTAPFANWANGIVGYESDAAFVNADGSSWTNPTTATATPVTYEAGDVLTVRRATGMLVPVTVAPDLAARTLTLKHNAVGFVNGDLVMLADCNQALLFRVTNSPVVTGIGDFPTVLAFATSGAGTGGTQGNVATATLTAEMTGMNSDTHASVMRFVETSYFVGRNAAGERALYRVTGTAIEELVDGIEDLDILYGVDTDLPEPDGRAENYVRAHQVANWGQVVSVRISALAYSTEQVATAAQTYWFRDTNNDGVVDAQTAPNRRLRQVFTTTIALRNRVQ